MIWTVLSTPNNDENYPTHLVVCKALVVVKVDDEDAARPLEGDHLVLLVLPAHVAGVGRQPPVFLLSFVQGRVELVEVFIPGRKNADSVKICSSDTCANHQGCDCNRKKAKYCRTIEAKIFPSATTYRRFSSSIRLNWRRA